MAKQTAVWQSCQFVVISKEPCALFLLFALGDVLQDGAQSSRASISPGYVAARERMRDFFVAAQKPKLVAPMAGIGLYRCEQFFLYPCTIVRMNVLEPRCHGWRGMFLTGSEYLYIIFALP